MSDDQSDDDRPLVGFKWYHWGLIGLIVVLAAGPSYISGGAESALGTAVGTFIGAFILVAVLRAAWNAVG